MKYIELALFIVGVVALVIGYRKNHRNVLLSAAIILFWQAPLGTLLMVSKKGSVQVGLRQLSPSHPPNRSFEADGYVTAQL